MKLFWKYFRNNSLCKKRSCFFKNGGHSKNKLTGLLIIAGGSLLLSQEHIKERREQREWVRLRIRKKDSKGAYHSVINDLSLTDKEDFRKYLRMNILAAIPILLFYLNKN